MCQEDFNAIINNITTRVNYENDRNINSVSLPIKIENESEYISKIKNIYDEYINELSEKVFREDDNGALLKQIKSICRDIYNILKDLCNKKDNEKNCYDRLAEILNELNKCRVFTQEFDLSYAVRGVYHEDDCQDSISLYRIRKGKVSKKGGMYHKPCNDIKYDNNRFDIEGYPCLYLGTTSLVCYWETNEPSDFSISVYKPNEKGKKLKILNLAISKELINGFSNINIYPEDVYIQKEMLKIFPLVIATSITVSGNHEARPEYELSHLIMKYMEENGTDGIAYLSTKGRDGFQFPYGVNIAFPAIEKSQVYEGYGKILEYFVIGNPIYIPDKTEWDRILSSNEGKNTYILKHFCSPCIEGLPNYTANINMPNRESICYPDSAFAALDKYLEANIKCNIVWCRDFFIENDEIWFISGDIACLMKHSLKDSTTILVEVLPIDNLFQESVYAHIYKYGEKVFIFPIWGSVILIYNINTKCFSKLQLDNSEGEKGYFVDIHRIENKLICMPMHYNYVVSINLEDESITYLNPLLHKLKECNSNTRYISQTCRYSPKEIIGVTNVGDVFVYNIIENNVRIIECNEKYNSIAVADRKIYLFDSLKRKIVVKNCDDGCIINTYGVPSEFGNIKLYPFLNKGIVIDSVNNDLLGLLLYGSQLQYMIKSERKKGTRYSYCHGILKRDIYFNQNDCKLYSLKDDAYKEIGQFMINYKEIIKIQNELDKSNIIIENSLLSLNEFLKG